MPKLSRLTPHNPRRLGVLLVLALALQPAVLLFAPVSPASACHLPTEGTLLPEGGYPANQLEPVWLVLEDHLGGRDPRDAFASIGTDVEPEHRVKTAGGQTGSSECVGSGPTAAPGEWVVSDANDLGAGLTYGIRLASDQGCAATGTYYDFAGGVGPTFAAAWQVPTTAPSGGYVVCLTHEGVRVEFTQLSFSVSE